MATRETLVICDPEAQYAMRLADAVNRDTAFPLRAEAFSSAEAAAEYLQRENAAAILIDRELAGAEKIKERGAGRILYLADVRGYPWVDSVPAVYKYQSVSQIEQEILEKLSETAEPEGDEKLTGRAKHVGVVSPVGRSFKTSFVLTLGQLLAERGRILAVSFERFSSFETLFGRQAATGLSDLLYACGNGCAPGRMADFTERFHDLVLLPPVEVPEDLDEADPAEVRKIILTLARETESDLVLYDLGNDPRYLKVFLPHMEKIYVPGRQDAVSESKTEAFVKWLGRLDATLPERTEQVIIPGQPLLPGAAISAEQLLWSGTGSYVRSLLGGVC